MAPFNCVQCGKASRQNAEKSPRLANGGFEGDRASLGTDDDQHGTSHVIFRHAFAGRLSVPARRPIKPVYVRLFVEFVDTVGKTNEN